MWFTKKKANDQTSRTGFSSSSTTENGTTTRTVTETRFESRVTTESTLVSSNQSLPNMGGLSSVLPSLFTKKNSRRFSNPAPSNSNQSISNVTQQDARPINLNYQSPYRNSPVYSSYQGVPRASSISSTTTPTRSVPVKIPTAPPSNNNKLVVKKTTKKPDVNTGIPTYKTVSKKRGEILIINNIMFEKNSTEREGAVLDHVNLERVFQQLGFTVHIKKNLKKKEMDSEIKSFSKRSSLKNVDISVVVVMSHGTNHQVRGGYTEIYGVDDVGYATDEIIHMFTAEKCKALSGKPKIFIFQCCRGDNTEFVEHDAIGFKSPKAQGYSDMLIAHSTLPGFVSHRSPVYGTWYIQTLCEVLCEYAHEHHFEDLLKLVDQKLAQFNHNNRQISSYESRGFQRCYLNPI